MSENRNSKDYKEIFNRILDSLVENELQSFGSAEDYLRSEKASPEKLVAESLKLMTQWRKRVRLRERKKQYETLCSKFKEMVPTFLDVPVKNLRDDLVKFLSGGDKNLTLVFWHKLEKLTDVDLRMMANEQKILEYLISTFEDESEGDRGE